MKVIATLVITGEKETQLVGKTDVFDKLLSYEGSHKRLTSIGFWMRGWRYAGYSGPPHKSRVFCPWTSCLKVETLKEGREEK